MTFYFSIFPFLASTSRLLSFFVFLALSLLIFPFIFLFFSSLSFLSFPFLSSFFSLLFFSI